MSLQDLKAQVTQLPAHERLELVGAIVESLRETLLSQNWQFLVYRPHPWRKQLSIKGRKLYAATLWRDLLANQMTPEQAADNWDLPLAAVHEAVSYCEMHQDLLALEAEEERYRLQSGGISLEPSAVAG